MNRSMESALRFVNLTTSGLLAGSLGFGEAALVPGWQQELGRDPLSGENRAARNTAYFDAIGPVALGTAIALVVGSRSEPTRRLLDAVAAVGLAGVMATTLMGTVPITRELEGQPATDYPDDRSLSLSRNWGRVHTVRRTLGIGAFVCAVASNLVRKAR